MTFLVKLQRDDALTDSETFGSMQEAQTFVGQQHKRSSLELAAIVEFDKDGKEIRTHRIDHFV